MVALRRAGEDESLLVPRVWMEALEPRVMFSATAATLALDRGFGHGGFMPGTVAAAAVGPKGEMFLAIVPTDSHNYELVKLDSHARLDQHFGTHGVIEFDQEAQFGDMAQLQVQADGKPIFAVSGIYTAAIYYRNNSDGTPDQSFGTGGHAYSGTEYPPDNLSSFWMDRDGKIVTVYDTYIRSQNNLITKGAMILRLNSDGTPDKTFGANGVRALSLGDGVAVDQPGTFPAFDKTSATQLANGDVIAYFTFHNTSIDHRDIANERIVEQVRLDAQGNEVSSRTILRQIPREDLTPMEMPDGSLLVRQESYDGITPPTLTKYSVSGQLDQNFGVNGTLSILDFGSMTIQPDGKILMVTHIPDGPLSDTVGLYRLHADGSPDLSFAGGQVAYNQRINAVNSLVSLPNGLIFANVDKLGGDPIGDTTTTEVALIEPQGGTPNTFDLMTGPTAFASGDAIGGTPIWQSVKISGDAAAYRGLFSTASGTSLFNPEGKKDLFGEVVG